MNVDILMVDDSNHANRLSASRCIELGLETELDLMTTLLAPLNVDIGDE
jgi:hypothetical protein